MKGHGNIGFQLPLREVRPGVWKPEEIVIKHYTWDLDRLFNSESRASSINTEMRLNNTISIVADPFLNNNITSIIWVEFLGAKWQVSSIDASNPPRLLITLGGVYNDETESA